MNAAARWLRTGKPRPGSRVSLVCFPYAGGTAATYLPWQALLPESIAVYSVQLPGRAQRIVETPHVRMSALLDDLESVLLPKLVEGPVAFFGHSMGAIIAFELTRRLRMRRAPLPVRLFVSGHAAPHSGEGAQSPHAPLHTRPREDLVDYLRSMNGTPDEILANAEATELVLGALRADLEMLETWNYAPEKAIDVPIVALCGEQDHDVPFAEMDAWAQHTRAGFSMHRIPGDHFFVESCPERVVGVVRDALKPWCANSVRTFIA